MAILKSGIGNFSGKLGGLRAWESNGKTIVAAVNKNVKNPKTEAQMKQRVKMNNILNIYKVLKPALQENFEGISGNKNAATFFRKYNLMQKPVWLTKRDAWGNKAVIAPYIVSYGIIAPIEYSMSSAGLVSNIELGTQDISATAKIDELSATIIGLHEDWCEGDTLQVVATRHAHKQGLSSDHSWIEMASVTFILTTHKSQALASVQGFNQLKDIGVTMVNRNGHLAIDISDSSNYIYALALVHGRGTGIKRLLSTQSLVLNDTSIYDRYTSPEQMVEALVSYKTKM